MIYSGKIIHGLQKGRTFGYPTANIALNEHTQTIEYGVYAVQIFFQDHIYGGMLYVGTRPTLKMKDRTIEIHLFNFSEEIYNQLLSFKIIKKIRNEITFSSTDQLINQINTDYEQIKKVLANL